jgi:hypothetical protein
MLAAVGSYEAGSAARQFIAATYDGGQGGVTVVLLDGAGNVASQYNLSLSGTSANPEGIVAGRFTNSGFDDLAVADQNGAVHVFRGDGKGQFTEVNGAVQLPKSQVPGANPTYLATAMIKGSSYLFVSDFNYGKFNANPAVVARHNAVLVYRLGHQGKLQLVQVLRDVSGPNQIAVADFNQDGKLDLAVANSDNASVTFFRGNGQGRFRKDSSVVLSTVGGGPAYPVGLSVGNLDAGTAPDLAVADNGAEQPARTVNVLQNTSKVRGRITFKAVQSIAIGQDLVNVARVQLGDALPGLAVTSNGDNTLYVLHNQGSFNFGNAEAYPDAGPDGVAGASIAGEEALVVVNSGSNTLSLYKPSR